MTQLTITSEKVLEAAKSCPQAANALKILFPDVFKDNKRYPTGTLYRRIGHNNIYALLFWDGQVRFWTISSSFPWKNSIPLSKISDSSYNYLTYDEFQVLTNGNADEFEIAKITFQN